MKKILVVDDEKRIRNILKILLEQNNYFTKTAESAEQAVIKAAETEYDIFLLDINLPGINGIDLMIKLKKSNPDSQYIFLTAHGTVKLAVKAIKKGAYNFLQKPFDNEELLGIISGAAHVKDLKDKVKALESQIQKDIPFASIITNSPKLKKVLKMAEKVALSDTNILVTGESGTGKELLVREIHKISARNNNMFIPVNCAAIPSNLFESEFFGHKKGSFTGATGHNKGKFREADNGTLFLDEIGEMPLEFQPKLLRAIENNEVTPVGSSRPISTNVRIIAATNKNLLAEIENNNFREDLYYRLNIFQLHLPPLRERKNDIELLAHHFAKKFEKKITPPAVELLQNYNWPGNIRQLFNEIQRATILAEDSIKTEHLSIKKEAKNESISIPKGFSLAHEIDEIKKSYFQAAMKQTNCNKTQAAKLLGLSYRKFNYQWEKSYQTDD